MKKVLLVIAVAGFAFATPACKKCVTCKEVYPDGSSFTYPEKCGKKSEREAQETACSTAAAFYGGTCSCDKS
ncbi:MAG: hypothetical protein IPG10_13180 [Flavobacteriales bacterium]|jgi:hypothetical protein|nr:hypothetical protein [Flavobacteriales bacterium]MBK6753857.1 hypothetical protein [Flavobacteriales bacterium]MBK7083350.1 hypothetical protein [Flavobacteriales bacterium]MBK7270162.1 hypothetical protein [Flavobacteriales bacterium]MBK9076401.1 hypothetical protein [Flavobacteriales bacterium]